MPPTGTFWETAPSSAAWGQPGSRMVQTFSPDSRNQVTSISRSGTMTVAGGTTHKASSVTVNGNAATLYGDNTFARTGISLVNGNNTFTAIANDGFGSADTNVVTVFLPSSTSPTHDANGNMLTSGNRSYQYDDENQLIAVHVANTWRSEFVYDGMMRRRIQKDFTWSGSAWTQTNETRYLYFGRLMIQERTSQNVAVKGYTRGLDLSGSLSGAGGIGGVLSFTELFTNAPNRNFFYFSDAGGNITKIFDHGRNIRGTYLYDPYGNLIAKSGDKADSNTIRFSSKEVHLQTGLYYYGFRFYDPSLQRWLNADPIGERGGINLYQFVFNTPMNYNDADGLFASPWHFWLTFIAEYLKGTNPRDALRIAWASVMADFLPGSQGTDSEAANSHAMAGTEDLVCPQSPEEARKGTMAYIRRMLRLYRDTGLLKYKGYAYHALQDSWAAGHGYMPWYGGFPDWDHLVGDWFPDGNSLWNALWGSMMMDIPLIGPDLGTAPVP